MTNTQPHTWVGALAQFNARNLARTMDLDISSSDMGYQSEARGLALRGVAYDHHDGGIEIMLGGRVSGHITHTIGNVVSLEMFNDGPAIHDALRIENDNGVVILKASQTKCETCCDMQPQAAPGCAI